MSKETGGSSLANKGGGQRMNSLSTAWESDFSQKKQTSACIKSRRRGGGNQMEELGGGEGTKAPRRSKRKYYRQGPGRTCGVFDENTRSNSWRGPMLMEKKWSSSPSDSRGGFGLEKMFSGRRTFLISPFEMGVFLSFRKKKEE